MTNPPSDRLGDASAGCVVDRVALVLNVSDFGSPDHDGLLDQIAGNRGRLYGIP